MRGNSFLVCSPCDEIGSAYSQQAIKSFPRMLSMRMLQFSKMTQKSLIKMQILPIKKQNFEKPSRNPSNRTKVKILKKNVLEYLSKKIWFCVCSVTAEMFEHQNSSENGRKRSEIYKGHIRIWFRSKKNSKLSHACVPIRQIVRGTLVARKKNGNITYRDASSLHPTPCGYMRFGITLIIQLHLYFVQYMGGLGWWLVIHTWIILVTTDNKIPISIVFTKLKAKVLGSQGSCNPP